MFVNTSAATIMPIKNALDIYGVLLRISKKIYPTGEHLKPTEHSTI